MTYQFTGNVAFFVKGRYWTQFPIRVNASTYTGAMRLALVGAKKILPARTRIEGVEVRLERLGSVVSPKIQEESE